MKNYLIFRKHRGQCWTVSVGLTREQCGTISWNPERKRYYFAPDEETAFGNKSLQCLTDFIVKQQALVVKEVRND